MAQFGMPVLYALLVWWLSTGAIIYLDSRPRPTFRWSMLGATVLLAASLYGLVASSDDATIGGAYVGFSCGILIWAWLEMSFLLGFLTGPRKHACPAGCAGWHHFGHAIQAVLYHELAILLGAALVVTATWGQPNQIGTWTFLILWGMRQSAKLNMFLGVRNLSEELFPAHLQYLTSFLRKKRMNLLFPVSVTASTVIGVLVLESGLAAEAEPFMQTGLTFLATLVALAILEHWFLVLPLPATALWNWGKRSRAAGEDIAGAPESRGAVLAVARQPGRSVRAGALAAHRARSLPGALRARARRYRAP